jgi:IS30 family transposase
LAAHDRGGYDGDLAHARARERAKRPKPARLAADPELRAVVSEKLGLEWSPEQIATYLRDAHPERVQWHLCPETIYQALYLPARGALSRELTRKLRTGRPMRRRRRRPDARQVRFANPGASIATRPPEVLVRTRPGHWEGDLIVGRANRSAIGTLVERRSRYTRLIHLPDGHDADGLYDGLSRVLLTLPAPVRLTLTWDQGGEMARHAEIAQLLTAGIFFTDPASRVAARHQRKHQRPAPPVLPQGHGPIDPTAKPSSAGSKTDSTIGPERSSGGRPLLPSWRPI